MDEMRLLSRLRNVEGYENTSRQQLESVFVTPSTSTKHL